MTERPIEEVIGWERSDFDGCWWDDDAHWHYAATVDDLAAWLAGRRLYPSPRYERHLGAWRTYLNTAQGLVWYSDEDGDDPPFDGPTILQSLTAAVRKVADA